jgi:hypothetical protein
MATIFQRCQGDLCGMHGTASCSRGNFSRALHAGGAFDPLGLASDNSARTFKLREAEVKHGRLAMVAFLGAGACFGPPGSAVMHCMQLL